jgi:hypothetical protein
MQMLGLHMKNLSFLTSEKCNIFCKNKSTENIAALLRRSKKPHVIIEVDPDNVEGSEIAILGKESELHLFFSRRKEAGDPTSKMLLGAFNFVSKIETQAGNNKKYVLNHISECDMSIGILAKPAFSINDGLDSLLVSLLRYTDGLLFTGEGFVNKEQSFVLDASGKYDILM